MLPRRFALIRHVDYSGVSGIGVVAYGVAFADGHVVLRWCSSHPATSVWASIDDLLAVHGHGQATSIEWIDAPHGDLEGLPAPGGGRRARPVAAGEDEKAAADSNENAGDVTREPDKHGTRAVPDTSEHNGHPGSETLPFLVSDWSRRSGAERQQDHVPRPVRPGRHRRPETPATSSDDPR